MMIPFFSGIRGDIGFIYFRLIVLYSTMSYFFGLARSEGIKELSLKLDEGWGCSGFLMDWTGLDVLGLALGCLFSTLKVRLVTV